MQLKPLFQGSHFSNSKEPSGEQLGFFQCIFSYQRERTEMDPKIIHQTNTNMSILTGNKISEKTVEKVLKDDYIFWIEYKNVKFGDREIDLLKAYYISVIETGFSSNYELLVLHGMERYQFLCLMDSRNDNDSHYQSVEAKFDKYIQNIK